MRSVILRFFFGADEIVKRMLVMLELRKAAIEQNARNKQLAAAVVAAENNLQAGYEDLDSLKVTYAENKTALELAYNLELE
jgi:hypothetical protein